MPVRVLSSYGVVVLALCLAAPPLFAQPAARTTTSRSESGGCARAPINDDTAHLEQKLSAARASGTITLDGRLDEQWPSTSTAALASSRSWTLA